MFPSMCGQFTPYISPRQSASMRPLRLIESFNCVYSVRKVVLVVSLMP